MVHSSAEDMIKYWINSIPHTSCALFEKISDLDDGIVIITLVMDILCMKNVPPMDSKDETIG